MNREFNASAVIKSTGISGRGILFMLTAVLWHFVDAEKVDSAGPWPLGYDLD